eukprot:c11558_g1_i1.p1 GENE.c11558_g1_i1~~c11558_g1_i1.p1  ORF type:complete len:347 (+),score=68.41 c11558_g1_i1:1-1041(+)
MGAAICDAADELRLATGDLALSSPRPKRPRLDKDALLKEKQSIEEELQTLDAMLASVDPAHVPDGLRDYVSGKSRGTSAFKPTPSPKATPRRSPTPRFTSPQGQQSSTSTTPIAVTLPKSECSKVVVMGTLLQKDQLARLKSTGRTLGWTVVGASAPRVTHVVTNCDEQGLARRTIKYATAMLMGQWILSFEWVEACIAHNYTVLEDSFECKGDSAAQWGPRTGRLQHMSGEPSQLFQGCNIFLHGQSKHIRALLRLTRATLLKKATIPPKHESQDNMYVLVQEDELFALTEGELFGYQAAGFQVLTAQWVWESVSHFEVQDTSKFEISTETLRRPAGASSSDPPR